MSRRRRQPPVRWTEADAPPAKTEDGADFPAAAYAYVPDGLKPSGWKLRLWETPDAKETARQVGAALAALSPGGFRGRKVEIPADALPVVKRRIMAAWRKVHPDQPAADVPAALKESFPSGQTFAEVSDMVEDAIEAKLGLTDATGCCWVRDISDTWVVYSVGGGDDLFRADYSIDEQGNVTIGDPSPVDAETAYVTATEASDSIPGRVLEARGTDDAGGRVFRVQIIAYGDSKNGRRYPESVMRSASRLYEGAKAYDHHRTDEELRTSTIAGLVGTYRNVEATTGGLEGDLHLLPGATHTAEALDASLDAQASKLPALVGISHDVMARYRPVVDAGRRLMEAAEICSVNSADVVADPAAGGRVTRMVAGGFGDTPTNMSEEDDAMTLKELRALLKGASPEKRAELLTEHAAVLDSAGLTTEEINTLEPAEEKVLAGVGAPTSGTEAVTPPAAADPVMRFGRQSHMGRQLIRSAVADANLDDRLVESVTRQLPEQFTEADLEHIIDTASTMTRELEAAGLTPRVPDVRVTGAELDKKIARLDAMFAEDYAAGGYRSFKEAYSDITGDAPRSMSEFIGEDFNRRILRESIGDGVYDSSVSRGTESVSSSTWNTILGDSITRRLIAEYQQPSLQAWRDLVSSMPPINDFRTQRIERMGGYGVLPAVNQGAPYQPLTSPGNEEATYAITKRGGTEDLTLETIANDDLRVVQRIPKRLGLAAAQTVYRYVLDLLDTNITCTYDSVALFHASHSNTATNALSQANVSAGRKAMRKQTAYGDTSDVLSIVPKYILAVSDLEELAFEISSSPYAVGVNAGTAAGANISNLPNLHQGLQPIVIDYWSSTTKWIMVADPNMVPTIEMGFYQGRQDPELFTQNDPTVGSMFNADKVTYKIRHIYSGTVLDHRAFYRGNT